MGDAGVRQINAEEMEEIGCRKVDAVSQFDGSQEKGLRESVLSPSSKRKNERKDRRLKHSNSQDTLEDNSSDGSDSEDDFCLSSGGGSLKAVFDEDEDDEEDLYYSRKRGVYLTPQQVYKKRRGIHNLKLRIERDSDDEEHKGRSKMFIPISPRNWSRRRSQGIATAGPGVRRKKALWGGSGDADDGAKTVVPLSAAAPVTEKDSKSGPNGGEARRLSDATELTSNSNTLKAAQMRYSNSLRRASTQLSSEIQDLSRSTEEKARRWSYLPKLTQMKKLFTRKQKLQVTNGLGLPLLASAIMAPFMHYSRDDAGRSGVPVVLQALKIQVRVVHQPNLFQRLQRATAEQKDTIVKTDRTVTQNPLHSASLGEHGDHLSYRTDIYEIHCTYGPLQWVVRRKLAEFLHLHLALILRSRVTKSLPPLPGFLRKQFVSLVQEAKQKTKDAISVIEGRVIGHHSSHEHDAVGANDATSSATALQAEEAPTNYTNISIRTDAAACDEAPSCTRSDSGTQKSPALNLGNVEKNEAVVKAVEPVSPAFSVASHSEGVKPRGRFSLKLDIKNAISRSLSPNLNRKGNSREKNKKSPSLNRRVRQLIDINEARRLELENYILTLKSALNMKVANELCAFLALSSTSLLRDGEDKGPEGYIKLQVRRFRLRPAFLRKVIPHRYKSMWISVKDNYVALTPRVSDYLYSVILLDKHFTVSQPNKNFHWSWKRPWKFRLNRDKLVIGNEFHKWVIKPDHDKNAFDAIRTKLKALSIGEQINVSGEPIVVLSQEPSVSNASDKTKSSGSSHKKQYKTSGVIAASTALATNVVAATAFGSGETSLSRRLLLRPIRSSAKFKFDIERAMGTYRFDSSFPERPGWDCEFYIDGSDYYEAVERAIQSARYTVYISGWWISPELYLRRPASKYPNSRLDMVLQAAAVRGVSIYIVVYKEVQLALTINSTHTKQVFESLHPNIRFLRHPDHPPGGVLFWALHEKKVIIDSEVAFVGGIDMCYGRFDTVEHNIGDFWGSDDQRTVFPGQDYSNPRIRDFKNVQDHERTLIDRSQLPRMAWHDIAVKFSGQPARDVGNHFVQRWNWIKYVKAKMKADVPYLFPVREFTNMEEKEFLTRRVLPEWQGELSVQLLRSAGPWNTGVLRERSIQNAYVHMIRNAKRHIYIENQFFISSTRLGGTRVRNKISESIAKRIIRAHETKEKFRVMIVLPILPAFEGSDFAASEAATIRIVMQYTYLTISRSPTSLLARLRDAGITQWQDYIGFYGLRTHACLDQSIDRTHNFEEWMNKLVTEQIYVHSKIILVDDVHALIGSANINDRSLLGSRDAELAVAITSAEPSLEIDCLGSKEMVVPFVYRFRMKLLQEHLGFSENGEEESWLCDLASDETWRRINDIAATNSGVYSELFKPMPDNSVINWNQYKNAGIDNANHKECHLLPNLDAETVVSGLQKLQGTLVTFAMDFLCEEDLADHGTFNKNKLVNDIAFI